MAQQPLYFRPNADQTCFMIADSNEGRYVNLNKSKKDGDIDWTEQSEGDIDCIKNIVYCPDADQFYVLFNKYQEKLGFYVLKIDANDIRRTEFLIKLKNKLDIGDTSLQINKEVKPNGEIQKELVISYKCIYINTYNVVVMDITQDGDQHLIFRHESFQLWESECQGFMLQNKNQDFIHLGKEGLFVLSLGSNAKRPVVDNKGIDKMIHSLESVNFLKQDRDNFVLFACTDPDCKVISIQQEF